jgi:pyroglutamyl-peptidase
VKKVKKLLLTGFEPFRDYSINPTMNIVEELNGITIGDMKVIGKILLVDFQRSGDQIVQYFEEIQPDAVISLGLAAGRYKITPERIAINCNDGEEDNRGYKPVSEPIIEDGPDGLFSSLPIQKIVDALKQRKYPAEISNTAGTYLCNHVMYRMLYHLRQKNLNIPAGFIHIPASHELSIAHGNLPSWSHRDLVEAVRICIEVL